MTDKSPVDQAISDIESSLSGKDLSMFDNMKLLCEAHREEISDEIEAATEGAEEALAATTELMERANEVATERAAFALQLGQHFGAIDSNGEPTDKLPGPLKEMLDQINKRHAVLRTDIAELLSDSDEEEE